MGVSVLFVGTALCIEIARIALGIRLLGLRPYEGQRVSAYAQGLLGLAFGLFVIRDPRIVVPVFLGMAWVDPLAALCRRRGWPRFVPTAAYLVLFLSTVFIMKSFAIPNALLFSIAATAVAMAMEGPKLRQIDDDLLLQVVPMVVLYLLAAAFGTVLVASPYAFELAVLACAELDVAALFASAYLHDPNANVRVAAFAP